MECESVSLIQAGSDGYIKPCHLCGALISRKSDAARHLDTHKEVKSYPCDWPGCNYGAAQKKNLETHMNKHTGARPYQCDYCHWAFGDPGSKTRHMKRKHDYVPMAKKPRQRVLAPVKSTSIKKAKLRSTNRLTASPAFSSDSFSIFTDSPSSLISSFSSPDLQDFTFPSDDLLDVRMEESPAAVTGAYIPFDNALQFTPANDSLLFSTLDMDIFTGNYAEQFGEFLVDNRQQSFLGPLDMPGIYAPDTAAFMAQDSLGLYLDGQNQVSSDQPWMNSDFTLPYNSSQSDCIFGNMSCATSTSSLIDGVPSIWMPEWNQIHFNQLY